MDSELRGDRVAGHRVVTEIREQIELDRREQRLRGQEPHSDLHHVGWIRLPLRHSSSPHSSELT
jgi:hypothetical protein